MQCNIDATGKRVRLISGIVVTLIGAVLTVLLLVGLLPGGRLWWIAVLALALGAFQIFEARQGWCAVRAMGFRTRV